MAINNEYPTNYHYVLWYDVERTILVKHAPFPYKLPSQMPAPRYLYLSSMGENSIDYHDEIATFLEKNPETKLVFQPGTFQMKLGYEKLIRIYKRTDIFFCNVEEAQRILEIETRDIATLLKELHLRGPKIVVITDSINGAYASDGTQAWFMPVYPHTPFERTGAGDAFASTVTSALAHGLSLEEALLWAPINSMSVVQYVGAQKGLLSKDKLIDYLKKAPTEYKPSPLL
jgi:sugar/nucleoside kinase (ribokinase family)